MRRLVLVLVLATCGSPAAPRAPKPRPSLAVLGLAAAPDDDAAARALTDDLRAVAAAPACRYTLAATRETLHDLEQLASCPDEAPACLAEIGAYLEVDYLAYGWLVRRPTGLEVKIDLMDVRKRFNRRQLTVPAAGARNAFAKLVGAW